MRQLQELSKKRAWNIHPKMQAADKKVSNRRTGINRAISKLTKEETTMIKDLVETILAKKYSDAEGLVEKALLSKAVDKIEERKIHAAKTFFESTQTVDEEAEQLDEISKEKLGKYIGKATHKASTHAFDAGATTRAPGNYYSLKRVRKDNLVKRDKRQNGIDQAVKKLTGKAKVAAT